MVENDYSDDCPAEKKCCVKCCPLEQTDKDDIYYKEPSKEEYKEEYKKEYKDDFPYEEFDETPKKKHKHVKLRKSIFRFSKGQAVPLREKHEALKIYEKPHSNKVMQWYAKRKAIKDLKSDERKEKKKLEKLEKWKQQEEKRIQMAQTLEPEDDAHIKREEEFIRQLGEIQSEKKKIIKNTLKTKYPYKVSHRPPPPKDDYDDYKDSEPYYDDKSKKENYADDDLEPIVADKEPYFWETKPKKEDTSYSKYDDHSKYDDSPKYDDYSKYDDSSKYDDYKKYRYDEPQPSKHYDDYSTDYKGYSNYNEPKTYKYSSSDKSPTVDEKFVSCFYRLCCEFSCFITVFGMITFTIILIA